MENTTQQASQLKEEYNKNKTDNGATISMTQAISVIGFLLILISLSLLFYSFSGVESLIKYTYHIVIGMFVIVSVGIGMVLLGISEAIGVLQKIENHSHISSFLKQKDFQDIIE